MNSLSVSMSFTLTAEVGADGADDDAVGATTGADGADDDAEGAGDGAEGTVTDAGGAGDGADGASGRPGFVAYSGMYTFCSLP